MNHAFRLGNLARGRLSTLLVLRSAYGGGVPAPEHHSESTEAMLACTPGLCSGSGVTLICWEAMVVEAK